jgi:hypothetical protein
MSPCLWAWVWASKLSFIPNLTECVSVKSVKLDTFSWNWVSVPLYTGGTYRVPVQNICRILLFTRPDLISSSQGARQIWNGAHYISNGSLVQQTSFFLDCSIDHPRWVWLSHIRDIRKVTLSLGLLSPTNPSFSNICKVRKFYQISLWNAEVSTKCWISAFNAQGLRGIIVPVHVGAVKIYVG